MALKAQQSTISVLVGGVLHEVEEVNNISGPDGKAKLIETTHLKSVGKEYLSGLADWGQISLDCNFASSNTYQMALRTMYATQAPATTFRIKVPDGANYHVFTFQAVVMSWSIDLKTDDKAGLKITLQVSGGVTYSAPGASPGL